jgi:hypothetical protein
MKIAIDFDGTCVTHEFPKIGKSIGAEPILKRLVKAGHQLILFTMRSDKKNNKSDDPNIKNIDGQFLADAIMWFVDNNIPLYGIQSDPDQKEWTLSPKAYAHLYIDDAALGCPLRVSELSERPYVNWEEVEIMLITKGILK